MRWQCWQKKWDYLLRFYASGVELNEEVARAHAYNGDRLHLTMWDRPIDFETYDARP